LSVDQVIVDSAGRGIMADQNLALSSIPPAPPAEADYDALCQALMETARGRWFLEEHARRNRNTDTRTVLDAIGRIEGVIRDDRARQASQEVRFGLLEMARTIAQTRAEVGGPAADDNAEPAAAAPDILAAAEHLQDMVWALRERGVDLATCDQIADLSTAILSASSLRDPSNGRARKLAEVLCTLEQRIDSMLDAPVEAATPLPAPPEPVAEAPGDVAAAVEIELEALPVDHTPERLPPSDPLAALKAMSDEERIALFT
jgi:hypothetical protein